MTVVRFLCLSLALGTALGCDPIANLNENAGALLDPEVSSYDAPGHLLVAGQFTAVQLVDNSSGRTTFVAQRQQDGEIHLRVVSLNWGAALSGEIDPEEAAQDCDGGRITSVFPWGERYDMDAENGVDIWAFWDEDGDGFGQMRFLDFDCSELLPPLEDISAESVTATSSAHGYTEVRRTQQGALYRLSPYEREVEKLADGVQLVLEGDGELLSLEGGDLVVRPVETLDEPRTLLTGVTELQRQQFGFSFVDAEGLGFFYGSYGEPVRVSKTGCGLLMRGLAYFYLDPCEEKRLVFDPGYGGVLVGPIISGRPRDMSLTTTSDPEDPERFLFDLVLQTESADELARPLYLGTFATPSVDASNFELTQVTKSSSVDFPHVLLDYVDGIGDYYYLGRDYPSSTLVGEPLLPAVELRWLPNDQLALIASHFDGKTTRLQKLVRNDLAVFGAPEELARGVAAYKTAFAFARPTVPDTIFEYLVTNSDGQTGELHLLTYQGKDSKVGESLADGVLAATPQPLTDGSVGYLSDDQSTLHLLVASSGLDVPVQPHVSEFFEMVLPSLGVVFVVESGPSQGIWFSKAR